MHDVKKEQKLARGSRLKDYRDSISKTMDEFSLLFGIGKSTLEYWENSRLNGLSRKGARKIAEISQQLAKQGAIKQATSLLWLYEGKLNTKALPISSSLNDFITHFLSHNKHAAAFEIQDNSHAYWLEAGDHVATIQKSLATPTTVNHLCLVWHNDSTFTPMHVFDITNDADIIAKKSPNGRAERLSPIRIEAVIWIYKPENPIDNI